MHWAATLSTKRDFARHWSTWQEASQRVAPSDPPMPAWWPDGRSASSNAQHLMDDLGLPDFAALHAWSVADRGRFWGKVLAGYGIQHDGPTLQGTPEHPVWFEGAKWNVAQRALGGDPARLAIRVGGEGRAMEDVDLGSLRALADKVSHGLHAQGLSAGDAVALYMPMDVACVAAYLGTVQAGMAVVSIADSFAPGEVASRLRIADAKILITRASFRRGGKEVRLLGKARLACARPGAEPVRLVVCGEADLEEAEVAWDTLLVDAGRFDAPLVAPDHVSNVLFSSGTTGEPKAIPWTHLTPWKAAMDGRYHQDIRLGDIVCWPTNIGWMMGPWLIYASLLNGAAMALWEGTPGSPAFLEFCNKARVDMLGVVPALVRSWREAGVEPHTLRHVRTFSSTGEASNEHDALYLMSLASYRAPVIEYCGGTEIGGGHITGSVLQPQVPAAFSTPALGLDFVVLDDAQAPASPGDAGEIFLRPPSIGLSERLLNKDHHQEYYADCPHAPGGPLRRHGDELQVLPGGYWRALGRADDTMNLGGIKVASVELERVADLHPQIKESAAIGVPPVGGGPERLVVFAVADGAADRLQGEVQGLLRSHLNPLFRLHELVLVDALPRTASNKVMRRELRARYARLATA